MDRKDIQFYGLGKYRSVIYISGIEYENGAVVVSTDDENLTAGQFERAVEKEYPGVVFKFSHEHGAYYARKT